MMNQAQNRNFNGFNFAQPQMGFGFGGMMGPMAPMAPMMGGFAPMNMYAPANMLGFGFGQQFGPQPVYPPAVNMPPMIPQQNQPRQPQNNPINILTAQNTSNNNNQQSRFNQPPQFVPQQPNMNSNAFFGPQPVSNMNLQPFGNGMPFNGSNMQPQGRRW